MSTKKIRGQKTFKNCLRNANDCIVGDSIYIVCQKPQNWALITKSSQHKGQCCTAKKDAKAIILRSYTNVKTK
jgi:hypothetical protein